MHDPAAQPTETWFDRWIVESPIRKFVWNSLLRVPWLIAFNVIGVALLVGLFKFTSQGQDLLRICAEPGFTGRGLLWNPLFLLATLGASLTFWYSSRLLLGVDYPGYPLDRKYAAFGRRWWPRLVGTLVPAAIGWTFDDLAGPGAPGAAGVLAWLYLAMAAVLLLFYVARRPLFRVPARFMVEDLVRAVPESDRRLVRAVMLTGFGLLVAFVLLPVILPRALGTPAIAVLGIAGISLFGTSVLTAWPLKHGAPPLTLLAVVLALVAGIWNDNHALRVDQGWSTQAPRPTPADRLAAWQGQFPSTADGRLILVATSGGGIRAAYWTASALAYLEQKFGAPFTERLFAISGVSGGSVGAAAYVALKGGAVTTDLLTTTRTVLRQDFLSPVVAGFLFPDLLQRFVPYPLALADRQRFLERGFEAAFSGPAGALFSGPFQGLYSGIGGTRLPSLLLNTTLVGSGQRAVFSNLALDGLPQVVDLLDPAYDLGGVRTSAAAGASARFTYLSPAGSVPLADGTALRLVDGGYFENSGTATLADLLVTLRAAAPSLRPILLLINNDTTGSPLCNRDGADPTTVGGQAFNATVSEVTAPAEALLNTRSARGTLAQVTAADLVDALGGAVIEVPLAAVLRAASAQLDDRALAVLTESFAEPPLGWSLSAQVREGMDQTLEQERGGLAREFGYLAVALGLQPGEVPRCNAR